MKTFFSTLILVAFFIPLFSQNKDIDKIEKLFRDGKYEKCIKDAADYSEKNTKDAKPFFLIVFSQFKQYISSVDPKREKLFTGSLKSLSKAKSKDKSNEFFESFSPELVEIKDSLKQIANQWYKTNKEKSKQYYEFLAKIYNDTTKEYREFFMPAKVEVVIPINPNQNKAIVNQKDINGNKQGIWKKKYPNGNVAYEVTFKNNLPVGEYKRYHENGKLSVFLVFDDQSKYAPAKFYEENGKLAATGFYAGKLKDSVWLYYDANGLVRMEEHYKNGKKNGFVKKYYTNGLVSEETVWIDDIQNGVWRQYYESGKVLLETKVTKGSRNGVFYKYFQDGSFLIKGHYKDDLMDGKWYFYDENSKKPREMEYNKGVAKNALEMEEKDQEIFKQMEQNKNKFKDPSNFINNPYEYLKFGGGGE